jgi:LPXTG-motif cell wall-anchored protein
MYSNGSYAQYYVAFLSDLSWTNSKQYQLYDSGTTIEDEDLDTIKGYSYSVISNSNITLIYYGQGDNLEITANSPAIDVTNANGDVVKTLNVSLYKPVTLTANMDGVTYKSSNSNIVKVDENGTITAKNVGDATITATLVNTDISVEIPVRVTYTLENITPEDEQVSVERPNGAELVESFDITKNDGWKVSRNYVASDDNGDTYYYYIEEVGSGSGNNGFGEYYYPIGYVNNGVQLTKDTNTVTVANRLTGEEVPESGVTLPMTGGTGTTRYYLLGGTIVMASTVLLVKRRKER